MKKIFFIILTVFIFQEYSFAESKDATPPDTTKITNESFLPILALNYCNFSLSKIIGYNDRIILDEEYHAIINNINLNKIEDDETFEIIKMLLDTIFEFTLDEKERDEIETIYSKKTEKLLHSTLKDSMSLVVKSGVPTDPIKLASSLISATKGCTGAYADYRDNMEAYKEQLDDDFWELDKKALTAIHEAHKSFLTTFRTILKRYNAPDEWRLTSRQFEDYVSFVKEQDEEKRYRILTRPEQESNLRYFNLYWYLRATTASKLGKDNDVNFSFNKFMELYQGFFRDDIFYSSILMVESSTKDYSENKDKLKAEIRTILDNDKNNWEKKMFAVGMFLKYEMYSDAILYLQANIDDNNAVSLSRKLLSDALNRENDIVSLEKLIQKAIKDDATSNQDIMYMIGKLDDQSVIKKFAQQILEIHGVVDESVIGKDNFTLQIPEKWAIESPENLSIELTINSQKKYSAKKIEHNKKEKNISFLFDEIMDVESIIENNKELLLSFILKTSYGDIFIQGKIVPKTARQEKGQVKQSLEQTKEYTINMFGKLKSKAYNLTNKEDKNPNDPETESTHPSITEDIHYVDFEFNQIKYLNSSFSIKNGKIILK